MTRAIQLLSLSLLFLFSCGGDDEPETPTSAFPDGIINYDGVNFSSPTFSTGQNEVAITFGASALSTEVGKTLSEVQFYMYALPESAKVIIYKGSTGNMPGTSVYSQEVASSLSADQWNTHILTENITIDDQDLWISIQFDHTATAQLIGCDEGPQIGNGAMILGVSDNSWSTFPSSINWNIRGKLTN